jgi:hypothetical protein
MLFVEQFYACFVSATFITIDPTELTLSTDSFIEETQRCLGVTFSCKEKIDRISRFINRPIVVAPLTPYFHPLFSPPIFKRVSSIRHRSPGRLFFFWKVFLTSARSERPGDSEHCDQSQGRARPSFLQLCHYTKRIRTIPTNTLEDLGFRCVAAFEGNQELLRCYSL